MTRLQRKSLVVGLLLLSILSGGCFFVLLKQSRPPSSASNNRIRVTPSAPNPPQTHGNAFSLPAKRINPVTEIRLLSDVRKHDVCRLWVCLRDKQLSHMYLDDTYTLRLWLFDRNWRLLNRAPIPVCDAYDARGRFRPRSAAVSLQPEKVEALFEVKQQEWQRADMLLVTGGGAYETPKAFDFELLIPKSSVGTLPKPKLSDSRNRLRLSGRKSPTRWRYWVKHSVPFQQSHTGWRLGAWAYEYLTVSRSASQATSTGWSQCLIWAETEDLNSKYLLLLPFA